MMKIEHVSENNAIVYLGNQIDVALTPKISLLVDYLWTLKANAIVEVIPSYTSVLIQFRPQQISFGQLQAAVLQYEQILRENQPLNLPQSNHSKVIELPVYYSTEVGPDLKAIAKEKQLSLDQVIAFHSEQLYTVCAIGFAPGFAFLASVNEEIATPRHHAPRKKIPAGSVGIANSQTAVYPADSPGGWQIIGNCPSELFNPNQTPMSPFMVGDQVRFTQISRKEFLDQGGEIWPHWK
ncbi:5-oxoprolinase subunit PxpB [Photobacterium makurazakiensis]|uniref:5-oxoprolinase subunit PxpB n=1 Tax=Photobacterium makurazakiensis TaxID=2910234 RepID=UPI003D0B294E